jgi:hypothetical protein
MKSNSIKRLLSILLTLGLLLTVFPMAAFAADPVPIDPVFVWGVMPPVPNASSYDNRVTETEQFTGTVEWRGYNPYTAESFIETGNFKYDTRYTAVITLTAKPGYYFPNVGGMVAADVYVNATDLLANEMSVYHGLSSYGALSIYVGYVITPRVTESGSVYSLFVMGNRLSFGGEIVAGTGGQAIINYHTFGDKFRGLEVGASGLMWFSDPFGTMPASPPPGFTQVETALPVDSNGTGRFIMHFDESAIAGEYYFRSTLAGTQSTLGRLEIKPGSSVKPPQPPGTLDTELFYTYSPSAPLYTVEIPATLSMTSEDNFMPIKVDGDLDGRILSVRMNKPEGGDYMGGVFVPALQNILAVWAGYQGNLYYRVYKTDGTLYDFDAPLAENQIATFNATGTKNINFRIDNALSPLDSIMPYSPYTGSVRFVITLGI